VLLKRCPCSQVLNTNDASLQVPSWEVQRELSIQCGLQQMPLLPFPVERVPSVTAGGQC
ncbi:hypothetical protein MTO96_038878, partial [Rhipicephalus appendiculatus]